MYAQRAIRARKCVNTGLRPRVCIRSTSSQSNSIINDSLHQKSFDSTPQTTKKEDSPNEHILDLAYRILGSRRHDIWKKVYRRTDDGHGQKRRLGVLDLSQSGDSNLIEALVGGKEASPPVRQALQSRWTSLPESSSRLVIRNGEKVAKFGSILEIPSDILAKNYEILEVKDLEHAAELIRAHLPVLVVQPGFQAHVPSLKHKKETIILMDNSDTTATDYSIHDGGHWRRITFKRDRPHEIVPQLYAILSGIDIRASAQSEKQDITRCILDECSAKLQSSSSDLMVVRDQTASFEATQNSLLKQLDSKFDAIELSTELKENRIHLHNRISSFSRFRFWDIDEFSEELQAYVIANYGASLERKLEYLAGSMAVIQERMRQLTNEYLSHVSKELDSTTLTNKIHQMEASEQPVPPSCFTAPILHRRRQLASIATPHMQSLYLRRVYAAMVASPIVTGAPALLWANGFLESSFALPSAILGLLLCARHISNAWDSGRSKWLADYDRIQQGLSEDIQKIVRDMLDRRLKGIPSATLEGSAQLIAQKENILQALTTEVQEAERDILSQTPPSS